MSKPEPENPTTSAARLGEVAGRRDPARRQRRAGHRRARGRGGPAVALGAAGWPGGGARPGPAADPAAWLGGALGAARLGGAARPVSRRRGSAGVSAAWCGWMARRRALGVLLGSVRWPGGVAQLCDRGGCPGDGSARRMVGRDGGAARFGGVARRSGAAGRLGGATRRAWLAGWRGWVVRRGSGWAAQHGGGGRAAGWRSVWAGRWVLRAER
jgi:hypothetical protein